MPSLLNHIEKFIASPPNTGNTTGQVSNRANAMGENLEKYIKNTISGVTSADNKAKTLEKYNKKFSYLGNANNIPDAILKNGDALEIKKVESYKAAIALNSSHPKDKLYANDTRISAAGRDCEDISWSEKDMFYAIGHIPKGTKEVSSLIFVHGELYAAKKSCYTTLADAISNAAKDCTTVIFEETNELAKVKNVDPLNRTDLRVRGMWNIESPFKAFDDIISNDANKYNFTVLSTLDKYNALDSGYRGKLEAHEKLSISKHSVPNPNNAAGIINCVCIKLK